MSQAIESTSNELDLMDLVWWPTMAIAQAIRCWMYIANLLVDELQPIFTEAAEILLCLFELMLSIIDICRVLIYYVQYAILEVLLVFRMIINRFVDEFQYAVGWYIKFETFTVLN